MVITPELSGSKLSIFANELTLVEALSVAVFVPAPVAVYKVSLSSEALGREANILKL